MVFTALALDPRLRGDDLGQTHIGTEQPEGQ